MLQKIRDKTAGVVVKVLFLFLVLSFAVWGIGDYKFLQRAENPVISIGGDPVPAEQVRLEFQRDLDRLRRSLGEIDRDVLRQFGVAGQSVERVTNQRTLDRAAERMSLVVSDAVVRQRIQEDPNFRGAAGFDANAFRRLLQRQRCQDPKLHHRLNHCPSTWASASRAPRACASADARAWGQADCFPLHAQADCLLLLFLGASPHPVQMIRATGKSHRHSQ